MKWRSIHTSKTENQTGKIKVPMFLGKNTLVLRSGEMRLKNLLYSVCALLLFGCWTIGLAQVIIRDRLWIFLLFIWIPAIITVFMCWVTFIYLSDLIKPSVLIHITPKRLRLGSTVNISWRISKPLESLSIYLIATENELGRPGKEKTLTEIEVTKDINSGQSIFEIPKESRASLSSMRFVVEWVLRVEGITKDTHRKIDNYFKLKVKSEKTKK